MKPNQYLEDLAQYLPALKGSQALAYFGGSMAAMRRALRRDEARGLITITTELTRKHQTLKPIIVIKPGDPLPSVQQIARLSHERWFEDLNPTLVIRGTAKLCAIYGGEIRTVVTANLSHDLALADVFLSKRSDPDFEWRLVQSRPGTGALPDAVTANGIIEVLGQYNHASIAAKLSMSGRINLEIW
jgi:hypothetical protein